MTRRTDRIGNLIRNTLGELMLSKLADPRFDPARTSITRVEVPENLLTAKVYVSVLGDDTDARTALRALRHATGHLQGLMAQRITLRHTPRLEFLLDEKFAKTLETLHMIDVAMDEIRRKEEGDEPDQAQPDERPNPTPEP